MTDSVVTHCSPEAISDLILAVRVDPHDGLMRTEKLLADFPADPTLHFLRGSLLAAARRYAEARDEMATSVRLSPEYSLARFQLGLLELTSGRPVVAETIWAPLEELAPVDPLRIFSLGLCHLIRDQFGEAIAHLREGIRLNHDNPPLNGDMQMLIERIEAAQAGGGPIPATHLLLLRYSGTKQ